MRTFSQLIVSLPERLSFCQIDVKLASSANFVLPFLDHPLQGPGGCLVTVWLLPWCYGDMTFLAAGNLAFGVVAFSEKGREVGGQV